MYIDEILTRHASFPSLRVGEWGAFSKPSLPELEMGEIHPLFGPALGVENWTIQFLVTCCAVGSRHEIVAPWLPAIGVVYLREMET